MSAFVAIAAGPDGHVWALDAGGRVWQYVASRNGAHWRPLSEIRGAPARREAA